MAECPYCNKPVVLDGQGEEKKNEILRYKKGLLKKELMYACPHCQKILGFSTYFGGLLTGRP